MDFYSHQDKAKTKTVWLYLLLIIGLVILSTITMILSNLTMIFFLKTNVPTYSLHSFFYVFIPISTVVILLSCLRYLSLKGGGRRIAETLMAKHIDRNSTIASERKLLNVIEEMAIAANIPVPPAYLFEYDESINAFAAGFSINDAVIGVTKGAVELLTREELQAVIAHEISHILNGDIRINMRLTAVLFGFSFLMEAARTLLDISTRSRIIPTEHGRGPNPFIGVFLLALLFYVFGALSYFWSLIIQSAINRQREYLADASAVQFTRYPKSLANALMKIGGNVYGSTLISVNAGSYSHLFFANTFDSLLSTHPPLTKRIKRVYPNWNGVYPVVEFIKPDEEPITDNPKISKQMAVMAATMSAAGATINASLKDFTLEPLAFTKATSILNTTPINQQQAIAQLDVICREPMDACYFIFALLLDDDPSIRVKQLAVVKNMELIKKYHQTLLSIPKMLRLTFIEKSIPTLKTLSEQQYKHFKLVLLHFIEADNKVSITEWLIYQLILHQVQTQYDTKTIRQKPRYNTVKSLQMEICTLLSAVAWFDAKQVTKVNQSFITGINTIGLYTLTLINPVPDATDLTPCLEKLKQASEDVKKKILRAVLTAIDQDKKISSEKAMFLRILSLCLDCPIAVSNEY